MIKPKPPVSPFKKKEAAPAPEEETPTATPEATPAEPPVETPTPAETPTPTEEPKQAEESTPAAEPTPATEPEPQTEEPAADPEPQAEEPAAEPESAAEPEAETAPEQEETAAPAAEAEVSEEALREHERQMEEYNRQLEEYNRAMEEYNRQMAELAAQEAAAAEAAQTAEQADSTPAEAPAEPAPEEPATEAAAEPEPAPAEPAPAANAPAAKVKAPKLGIKKPAGGLKKAAKPTPPPTAGVAPTAESPTEAAETDEQAVEADYVAMLQQAANKPPLWKNKLFIIALGGLVVCCGLSGYAYMKKKAEDDAVIARNEKVKAVLGRAQAINREGIETLADAKAKGVDVKCSKEEAEFLMNIVVNPAMKDDRGKPMFGNNPDGVAQLAILLIGLACEESNDISKQIFERMENEAPSIKPALFRWLVQRLAATNIKGINTKLRKLADAVSNNETPKFIQRDEMVAYIWEAMGLRVSEKDIPGITKLLGSPSLNNKLGNTLLLCLYNIIRMIDDPHKKSEVGDKIFDALSDDMRVNAAETLAASCSPKAEEFFKKRALDAKNWRTDFLYFANYGNDDILPFILELKEEAGDDKKNAQTVQRMIEGLFSQNRERTVEVANQFLSLIPNYDKVNVDTSNWDEVNELTDPNGGAFIGEDDPRYTGLMQQRSDMEASRKQKLALIKQLSSMSDHKWVTTLLNRFAAEKDSEVARRAGDALEKTKEVRAAEEQRLNKYKSRDKS